MADFASAGCLAYDGSLSCVSEKVFGAFWVGQWE